MTTITTDLVVGGNCGAKGYVPTGTDICPSCGYNGALTFVDKADPNGVREYLVLEIPHQFSPKAWTGTKGEIIEVVRQRLERSDIIRFSIFADADAIADCYGDDWREDEDQANVVSAVDTYGFPLFVANTASEAGRWGSLVAEPDAEWEWTKQVIGDDLHSCIILPVDEAKRELLAGTLYAGHQQFEALEAARRALRVEKEELVRPRADAIISHAEAMYDLLKGILLREDIADDEIGEEIRAIIASIEE